MYKTLTKVQVSCVYTHNSFLLFQHVSFPFQSLLLSIFLSQSLALALITLIYNACVVSFSAISPSSPVRCDVFVLVLGFLSHKYRSNGPK